MANKVYAVIDTNVLVSAMYTSNPQSPTKIILDKIFAKEDAYLVTGNSKHFPKKPIVVSPTEFLEILKQF